MRVFRILPAISVLAVLSTTAAAETPYGRKSVYEPPAPEPVGFISLTRSGDFNVCLYLNAEEAAARRIGDTDPVLFICQISVLRRRQ